jgi:hypothetical protein
MGASSLMVQAAYSSGLDSSRAWLPAAVLGHGFRMHSMHGGMPMAPDCKCDCYGHSASLHQMQGQGVHACLLP